MFLSKKNKMIESRVEKLFDYMDGNIREDQTVYKSVTQILLEGHKTTRQMVDDALTPPFDNEEED
jgi:hypothetical protein